jgi:hypothetical protein
VSNNVYANGNAIACKSGDDKVIAAFPDVCLSPPSPPAGPIPVPYPDTSFSKDMQNGTKTVQINGAEVMMKDQSFYKTSPLGDEAATNGLGAGVVTHVITGKTYFVAWSMDVKFEGANVDRHLDLTTSNHASPPPNEGAPIPGLEDMSPPEATQGKLFCDCCGEATHSKAQAFGDDITEDEHYFPPKLPPYEKAFAELVLTEVRAGKCKDLLPPKPPGDDPCNKYYRAEPKERQDAREAFRAAGRNPMSDPIGSRPHIYGKGQQGHRVPVSGGGCPLGKGNLHPVSPECDSDEKALSYIQSNAIKYGPAA